MPVSLVKPIVGCVHIAMASTHPNPASKARELARASFWHLPSTHHAITAVTPEPYDALRKFSPHVIYTVSAY